MAAVVFFAAVGTILLWRLATLTHGLSPAEKTYMLSYSSLNKIAEVPLYAPHKAMAFAFERLDMGMFGTRLTSVLFAVIIAFCFYKLAVGWFGKLIGLFGSI